MAEAAGLKVNFIVDDLTNLQHVAGPFDLLVDYGTLDDLKPKDRDLYVKNVLQLTRPGSQMLLFGFEYPLRWWEQLIPLFRIQFEPGEVERLFGDYFEIKRIAGEMDNSRFFPGYAVYLMKRKT
jgi:cyclopropane fatty-acyl-phospholipid synthase-like methyltransferase